jgi:hypothetical protein
LQQCGAGAEGATAPETLRQKDRATTDLWKADIRKDAPPKEQLTGKLVVGWSNRKSGFDFIWQRFRLGNLSGFWTEGAPHGELRALVVQPEETAWRSPLIPIRIPNPYP